MKLHARIALFVVISLFSVAVFADEYKFEVTNNSGQGIKKIMVSEDGSSWGQFNIGKGIAAGATVTLVWDESTNGESCEQYFKAVFADGSESEAAQFDFCEADVALEFE
ncbi:MAG TPA: hypothetical protein VEU30_13650 [Thermoanaerobaculia bacterium]|nr:hypothetical protein [Thermoanaerobaculia bacterium]